MMQRYARIQDGRVVEIVETDRDIGQLYHPSLKFVSCDASVRTGYHYAVADGFQTSVPVVDPMARQEAINWLDATADRIRASDRSVGQYLDAEYQLVAQALADYRAQPSAEVPEAIQSYAAAEGLTVEDAAQQIAEAAARADDLLQNVRRIRLAGKAAIRDAGDDADFMETARPFIDQLEMLASV